MPEPLLALKVTTWVIGAVVMELEALEKTEVPAELVALTVKVYWVFCWRPVTLMVPELD